MQRTILHSDMNNFYASVECLYHPELRDKPVIVCGNPELRHGIVLAKNYLAKSAGIITGEAILAGARQVPRAGGGQGQIFRFTCDSPARRAGDLRRIHRPGRAHLASTRPGSTSPAPAFAVTAAA